jgi:hypothetical protein
LRISTPQSLLALAFGFGLALLQVLLSFQGTLAVIDVGLDVVDASLRGREGLDVFDRFELEESHTAI